MILQVIVILLSELWITEDLVRIGDGFELFCSVVVFLSIGTEELTTQSNQISY